MILVFAEEWLVIILKDNNVGIVNAPVICNHTPTYGVGCRIVGLRCRAITFPLSPQCGGSARVLTLGSFLTLGSYPPREFSVM